MPRETKAYACEWGCRRNVLTSRKDMAEHETRCFHNPARKACVTCVNFEPATGRDDDYEAPGWAVGYEVHEKLKHDCDKWSNAPDEPHAKNL